MKGWCVCQLVKPIRVSSLLTQTVFLNLIRDPVINNMSLWPHWMINAALCAVNWTEDTSGSIKQFQAKTILRSMTGAGVLLSIMIQKNNPGVIH